MKRKSPLFVKILACLLLLGSFAAFYPSWLKLSADVASPNLGPEPVRMSPGEIIQNFTGMDAAAVKDAAAVGLSSSGVPMDAAVLNDLLDRTLDGHFNLPGLAFLCRDLGELCTAFQRPDVGQLLSKANLAVWIAFGLLILLGLVALVCQLTDHPAGILPYFLLGALMVVGLQLLRKELNGFLTEQSEALFAEFGIGELTSLLNIQIEVEMVKMGIGAYLCPFLALLAMLFSCIRKKQPKSKKRQPSPYPARRTGAQQSRPAQKTAQAWQEMSKELGTSTDPAPRPSQSTAARPNQNAASRPSQNAAPRPNQNAAPAAAAASIQAGRVPLPREQSWTCTYCGRRMEADKNFCDLCGSTRPKRREAIYCSACGAKLRPDARFCSNCGRSVMTEERSGGAAAEDQRETQERRP